LRKLYDEHPLISVTGIWNSSISGKTFFVDQSNLFVLAWVGKKNIGRTKSVKVRIN